MKKERNLNELLEAVKGLNKADQAVLADQILQMLSASVSPAKSLCKDLVEEVKAARPDCPHCAAKAAMGYVVKRGLCRGAQRYRCKSCGRYFVSTTNTVFSRSRKDADTWRKFIALTIEGKSLKYCASECGIAYQTAFTWRHKILNAFVVNQNAATMRGNVEIDEMLLPISYKGNHVKGTFKEARIRKSGDDNNLPRKSFCRGSDNKAKSHKERVCVFCMVEDGNKAYYAGVPGLGFMNAAMLDRTIGKHIRKETALVLADNYKTTRAYLEEKEYRHMILLSNTSDNPNKHKPEIRDGHHLQHVNAMHRHIRKFLSGYYGVSTKYLENYLALYVWLKSFILNSQKKNMDKASVARAAVSDCYISRRAIENRPMVPNGGCAA